MIYQTNYLKRISYLINHKIYEYDISKANINILLYKGVLDINEYNRIYNLPRINRQKEIGIMILKDRNIEKIINSGIIEMREKFLLSNNISDNDILSCKNDAIFVINKVPSYTKFDNVEFKLKNTYTSFYKTPNYEFYYLNDSMNGDRLDVKGINDEKLLLHKDYMIDFCKALFNTVDYNINDAVLMVRNFYREFMNNNLDIGYYRNFDPDSLFKINIMGNIYDVENITQNEMMYINKDCNINFIRTLWRIITFIQFRKQ